MSLPGFLCIGAQKAGTSWLFAQLRTHPEVWMPPVKELQFFSHLHVPDFRRWTAGHIRRALAPAVVAQTRRKGGVDYEYLRYLADLGSSEMFSESWYRHAYSRAEAENKLTGDITPEYSTIPEAGIQHIRDLLGDVKIIYLIREPLARALSQLRMNVKRRALGELDAGSWREMADHPSISNRGDYITYVPRWKKFFASDKILFLPYGQIVQDPMALMRRVESFLGLRAHNYPRLHERIHGGTKISVPEGTVALLRDRVSSQAAFIAAEFGAEFAASTHDRRPQQADTPPASSEEQGTNPDRAHEIERPALAPCQVSERDANAGIGSKWRPSRAGDSWISRWKLER